MMQGIDPNHPAAKAWKYSQQRQHLYQSSMWRWYGKIEVQFHFIKDINILSETATALLDNS